MVHVIKDDPIKKRLFTFVMKYGSLVGTAALIPVIVISFIVVHQRQDLRQHASGPIDSLIYPPSDSDSNTDSTTQTPSYGLLRVQVNPTTITTISIFKNPGGVKVDRAQSSINGKPLESGNYYINFTKAGTTTPGITYFSIKGGGATDIVADFTTGKTTVSTK